LTQKLVAGAKRTPTWLVALRGAESERRQAYLDSGVEIIEVDADQAGHPDLVQALAEFAERGLTRLLAEGGSGISAALLRAGLVDRLVWFRAPSVMGGDGVPAAQPFGVDRLADMARFTRVATAESGDDLMEIYRRRD